MVKTIKFNYEPHEFQEKFHSSTARMRLMLSGIRGGKTWAGAKESIEVSMRGWKTFNSPNKGVIVAESYKMLRNVVRPVFEQLCPPELIRNFHKTEWRYDMVGGSEILLASAEDPDSLRGLDRHWFWLDEGRNAKEEVYLILLGRIDQRDGCGWVTTTAKRGWLQTQLVDPWTKGDKDFDVINFTSYDNPYYPKHRLEKLKRIYSDDFFNQEIMAKFISTKGLIYKDFLYSRHVKQFDWKKATSCIAGVDLGFEVPSSIVVVGRDSEGRAMIPTVYYEMGKTVEELIIVAKDWESKFGIEVFYLDPARPDAIESFNNAGLNAMKGNNKVLDGINKVTEKLRTGILIHPSCIKLIEEFENYAWRAGTDKPIKINDHALDALRYALMGEEEIVSLMFTTEDDSYKTY